MYDVNEPQKHDAEEKKQMENAIYVMIPFI